MPHTAFYAPADAVIQHLGPLVPGLAPPLQSQYTGFAAISAVTVYELAIKFILVEFAKKKHAVFGKFVEQHFDRINGRIGLKSLYNEHLPLFGDKYLNRFKRLLDAEELRTLAAQGGSIKSSYGNLVTWRHGFAHEGQLPANATFAEVSRSYNLGKSVIDCLAKTMVR